MNQPLVPTWVEKELESPNSQTELELLRNFYKAWQELHTIKGDRRISSVRHKHEQAAQMLVDAAMAINVLYHPMMLNG